MILHTLSEVISNNTLSERYYQIRINTFAEFVSNNTNTFTELPPNMSKHIFRVNIKQY